MNARKIVLWGIPVLTFGLAIACLVSALAFQGARQEGWTTYTADNSGLIDDSVRAIAFDGQGHAWIGTRGGVSVFDGGLWATVGPKYVHTITFNEQGRAWIGAESTVQVFDGETWTTYSARDSGLIADRIYIEGIAVDDRGRAWIGITYYRNNYQYSLSVFDGETWTNYAMDDAGLTGGSVNAVALDNQGRAWIGVNYYRPYNYYHHSVKAFDGESWSTYSANESGLAGGFINAIAFDDQGYAWVGTEHGVSVFDWETWITYDVDDAKVIAFDEQGRAWVGTERGLHVFDGRTWSTYTAGNSGLVDDNVTAIAFDDQNRAWIGTEGGVSVFSTDEAVPVPQSLVALRDCCHGLLCLSPVILIVLMSVWLAILFTRPRLKIMREQAHVGRRLWWTLANTLGLIVGYLVTFVVSLIILADLIAMEAGSVWLLFAITFAPGVAGGIAGGVAGGVLRWLALRQRTSQSGWWIPVGAVGFAVSYAVTVALTTLFSFIVMASRGMFGGPALIQPALVYGTVAGCVLGAVVGIVGGAVSGIVQWPILRQRVSRSGWWVLASSVGLAIELAASGIGTPTAIVIDLALFDSDAASVLADSAVLTVVGCVGVVAGGVLSGALTGGVLTKLLQLPAPDVPDDGPELAEGTISQSASEQAPDNLDEPTGTNAGTVGATGVKRL
jgi:hypothetical protein